MLVLVSGATRDVPRFDVGVLVEPRGRHLPEALLLLPQRWAMDNGAFSGFDEVAFLKMLDKHRHVPGCLFVAAPDCVGQAEATLKLFYRWTGEIRAYGYPVALVAQDGLRVGQVPWNAVDALFIGGTDAFKLGPEARALADAARARGLWLHMGRVNSRRRLRYASRIGCDSIDGSGFSKWPATLLPRAAQWIREWTQQPRLIDG